MSVHCMPEVTHHLRSLGHEDLEKMYNQKSNDKRESCRLGKDNTTSLNSKQLASQKRIKHLLPQVFIPLSFIQS